MSSLCTHCTNILEANSKFCTTCGTRIEQSPIPVSNSKGILITLVNSSLSLIVGLCIFIIIKSLLIVSLIIVIKYSDIIDIKEKAFGNMGSIVIVISIGLAIALTRKLNKLGTRKSRAIIRSSIIIAGIIALSITTFLKVISKTSNSSQTISDTPTIINYNVAVGHLIKRS